LLYKLLFFPSRIAIHFYCRNITINKKEMLGQKGPLMIAANHPNSFLDAIIISTLFKVPVHSLARGDAFAGKLITRLLKSCNMLPVYRVSEGVENLSHNYSTFDACQRLFEENEIVLIFSEGRCVNEWHLRSLKKGTARLALSAWQHHTPVRILPLGINYSSFRKFGKNVHINFGNIIGQSDIHEDLATGRAIKELNEKLSSQLRDLVYEIGENDHQKLKKYFYINQPLLKRVLLFIPALIGFIVSAPLYFAIHLVIKNRAQDHYDSIMTGLLFFLYPLYVLAIALTVLSITGSWYSLLILFFMPFTSWSYLQLKSQI
jgi:1-acyl-sn-glycerol-3-phosphate acyltransferase